MRLFLDASAIVAILRDEPEASEFSGRLVAADERMTSAIAVFEATLAAARKGDVSVLTAQTEVDAFLDGLRVERVPVGDDEARLALEAHARFGKGRHPARLNMGDCFAYACARANGAKLLYKGDDFTLTDIEAA